MPFYPPPPTSQSSFHKGNCHCGAVRFTVKLSPPLNEYPTSSCDCSICQKNGYLLVYPPTTDVTFHKGREGLKSYRFATREGEHQFCGECGSSCFLRLLDEPEPEFIAVNVRMLEDFEYDELNIKRTDGRSRRPEYKISEEEEELEEK